MTGSVSQLTELACLGLTVGGDNDCERGKRPRRKGKTMWDEDYDGPDWKEIRDLDLDREETERALIAKFGYHPDEEW